MPITAFAVGEIRVYCGVVQENHLLARIAFVVLGQCVNDGQRWPRAIALHHIARALVYRRLECVGGFLRAELVVDADDLELHASLVFLTEALCQKLKALELVGADGGHQTR